MSYDAIESLKQCCEDYLKEYDEYDKIRYLSKYTDELESTLEMRHTLLVGEFIKIYMMFEVWKL